MPDRKPTKPPAAAPSSNPAGPRSQRDLVKASLLRTPSPEVQWDERTRLEYREPSR